MEQRIPARLWRPPTTGATGRKGVAREVCAALAKGAGG